MQTLAVNRGCTIRNCTTRRAAVPRVPVSHRSSLRCTPVKATPPNASPDDDEDSIGMGLPQKRARLVSDNWEGDQYRGSNFNILTVILGLTFLVPVTGLLFAYLTYGTLWSSTGTYGRLYF